MRVAELMIHPAWSVEPMTTLRDAAAVMVAKEISGLPVIDGEQRVVGVVSEADILAKARGPAPHPGSPGGRRRRDDSAAKANAICVADAMTTPAVTVTPDASVAEAASLMVERDVERLPVVDDGGRLVGIITRADLVRDAARG